MKNAEQPVYPVKFDPQIHAIGKAIHKKDIEAIVNGITKREHFSIMCLQGLLSNPNTAKQIESQKGNLETGQVNKIISLTAIELADELLKQLETK